MASGLSLCMIVKNEAAHLEECLRSAARVVDEIVVVDTGSTDDSVGIAKRHGAKVSSFDFRVADFSAARNLSLAEATGRWALVLDADERLSEAAPARIEELLRANERAAYVVERQNVRSGDSAAPVDYAVRLFPLAREHRYRGRVHETVDASLLSSGVPLKRSRVSIRHLLPSTPLTASKSLFYLGILDEELSVDPDNVNRLTFRCAELHKLGRFDEATETAERIARLAPEDPANHVSVGLYRFMHKHDTLGAEAALMRALSLRPNDANTLACLREVQAARR